MVAVEAPQATVNAWLRTSSGTGEEVHCNWNDSAWGGDGELRKLLLFSGNDYIGLFVHPAVRQAAAQAAVEFGMGPRASPLVCGYTSHHRTLESTLAELKESQFVKIAGCWLFAELYIDGSGIFCLMKSEPTGNGSGSLFSMDGDFAPLRELAALRKRLGFLLVIDQAHGTLVCGENGGGVAEAFGVQEHVDIHVGTLSKAIGCHAVSGSSGFNQEGRSFILSTALPVPVVAAAYAAIMVAKKEKWRQHNVWALVRQFSKATGSIFTSPIAPILFGDADAALEASRKLLTMGFHVPAIRPPTVPVGTSRLRITFSAGHRAADAEALVKALPAWAKTKGPSPNFFSLPLFPGFLHHWLMLERGHCCTGSMIKYKRKQVRLRPNL